ncbi:UNVERIFIED_ORG: hypothetical protein FHR63_000103 [Xanthomonas campestris]
MNMSTGIRRELSEVGDWAGLRSYKSRLPLQAKTTLSCNGFGGLDALCKFTAV